MNHFLAKFKVPTYNETRVMKAVKKTHKNRNLLPTKFFFVIVPDAEMMKWYQKALAMNKDANIIIVPTRAQLEGQHHLRWRQGQKESCWISLSKQ